MGAGASIATDPTSILAQNSPRSMDARKENAGALFELVTEVAEENRMALEYVAQRDATTLFKATVGMGTDEKALVGVICNRTKAHLKVVDQLIRDNTVGNWPLAKLIKDEAGGRVCEVSGNLCKVLLYRVLSPVEFRAAMVDLACDGFGTDEELLVDTFVACSNAEIAELREHYETTRDKSLMDVMTSELSGEILLCVRKMLAGERDESGDVDEGAAEEAAEALYAAGEKNWFGTDEEAFVEALLGANPAQCAAINTAYENAHGKSLTKVIKSEFGSDGQC